ncbi:MAG: hypothetical protein KGJ01_02040 [Patescibacteria group bacterium]|nr:hypothetical protein [Patescibacteria group bacterium]
MLAEEEQELTIRALKSAVMSWQVPGTIGLAVGGTSLLANAAFRSFAGAFAAFGIGPSIAFAHQVAVVCRDAYIVGAGFLFIAGYNFLFPRKIQ